MSKSLKKAREEKGVKLQSVAEHLGVSRQTYASYETSPQSMSVGQAMAVCDFLHVDVSEIFFGSNVN